MGAERQHKVRLLSEPLDKLLFSTRLRPDISLNLRNFCLPYYLPHLLDVRLCAPQAAERRALKVLVLRIDKRPRSVDERRPNPRLKNLVGIERFTLIVEN